MEERVYDYWVATLQDGYIGKLIDIADAAGGAAALYEMGEKELRAACQISEKLAAYICGKRKDIGLLEEEYCKLGAKGISYVNHTDEEFPQKLRNIASPPYGLFVKGQLPSELTGTVAVIGARECSEYGRLMAEYFADRLAKCGVQIISGMAWGIDGIAQSAALDAGGKSYAVLGCGVDITYPVKNRRLYERLCENGNGVISEYAPGTRAESRRFPPRNRIISGLSDVLLVVEARSKSGTLITVDMAIDQGRTVMVIPGRLTDSLSAGCLKLLYQGALPATSVEAVMEQLGLKGQKSFVKTAYHEGKGNIEELKIHDIPAELAGIVNVLALDPKSAEQIASEANIRLPDVLKMLTRLELEGIIKEISPGYFVRALDIHRRASDGVALKNV